MSTPMKETMAVASVADRAVAYGMPGVSVDGQDVTAMYEAVSTAVDRARAGAGPTLIEARTYRYRDHAEYGNLDLSHRDPAEVEAWRARDPVGLLTARLLSDGTPQAKIDAIEAAAGAAVQEAVAFAKASPVPAPEELFDDLWATPIHAGPAPAPVPAAAPASTHVSEATR
jgi:pyruvate dehydrogenase E1 component alpha subunit